VGKDCSANCGKQGKQYRWGRTAAPTATDWGNSIQVGTNELLTAINRENSIGGIDGSTNCGKQGKQ